MGGNGITGYTVLGAFVRCSEAPPQIRDRHIITAAIGIGIDVYAAVENRDRVRPVAFASHSIDGLAQPAVKLQRQPGLPHATFRLQYYKLRFRRLDLARALPALDDLRHLLSAATKSHERTSLR
ncbi:hypothetical protein COL8621_01748 [Actibacterium lipolyticum]|uniref:Uncharacterized protein n=1 Tax=Actibacterium lipolyticum TaxID=1524263 RepID=A0A238K014_9RHOB|nr:hypothetical protein COL8621_01748 [Actibacterium lipolyticum]